MFVVTDKGKIPANAKVAWVIPQSGLSAHKLSSSSTIPAVVEAVSSLGQISVIQFRIQKSENMIEWEASVAEVKRLNIELGILMHIEIDASQIHIMPLRPINDPRRFQESTILK
jgi:molybdate transport system ATP-binding protein